MTDFQEGDRVRIREDSNYYGRNSFSNPAHVTGTVIGAAAPSIGMPLRVRWDERGANTYNYDDLEHADRWVVVNASPPQGPEVWRRLTSRLDRIGNCADYPSATQRIFLNLSTGQYTNMRGSLPPALRRMPIIAVELTDIVGE